MRQTRLKSTTAGVVIVVACVVVLLSVFRAGGRTAGEGSSEKTPPEDEPPGAALFEEVDCGHCHATESGETKAAPGLDGLFDREELPSSGRPVTEENVRRQLVDPYKTMPSYEDRLDPEQIQQLVDYMKTL
jgi:mono/diheme cytochrome c family protein